MGVTYPCRINFRVWYIFVEPLSLLGINNAVNDSMRDMDTLGPKFTRERLGHGTDTKLAHGKCGEPRASFNCRRRTYCKLETHHQLDSNILYR